ncbi:MAG: gingipain R, partial [Candidatus Cloacimonetes bacterium HGW-Cloacimonetes-3]
MKRVFLVICLALFAAFALSAETVTLGTGDNSLSVVSSSTTETILQYRVNSFEKEAVQINGAEWYHIRLPKEGITQDKGMPELPVFNRSIIIDNNAFMKLEMYDLEYQDIKLPVAPSKGVITRNIDPKTVPYTFDKVYLSGNFYPEAVADLSQPYILRDFRGITIKTTPFSYNPATQILRVYTNYKIRVYTDGLDTVNTLNSTRDAISKDFAPIYENHFVNWNNYRYTPVSDAFGKLLVICHTNYLTQIAPYVNWKKQKGITTELVEWSTIGTTAAQLQTYIQTRYNADNSITYVQIVGDAPQIPSLASGGGGSDPTFALVAGSDYYPDIFIGRFSAETTAQVTTQVNKAITYERDLTTTATWLNNAMGIASAEGGGTLGDNGESDIVHMNGIRTDLLSYGYTTVDQIYDPSALASTVTTNVNAGRGFINYVGHGSDTSWVTTGFSSTNATALTNGTKTPFIMDVACVNGNFVSITCFAEAWLRNANGGAVAMYASSINQDWNAPMLAEDECTDLILAGTKTTTGGLYYNSSCKMMDTYGNTSGSSGANMYLTWHIFGDASLMVRTKTPQAMTVTHPATILIGATSVTVNTGVANARVALTYNNTIYGVATANSSGVATVTLSSPPASAVTYVVTATAFNRVTYVGSLQQIAGSGPFMSVETTTYADSNNNVAEYSDSGRFNVTFKNIGTATATSVSTTLTCSTSGITITDGSESIASIAASTSTTINNAYSFNIASNVTNGTSAAFTITMVAGSETWTYNFNLTLNAPLLAMGSMTISDPSPGNNNGRIDPGETVTITMPLNNTGAAASPAGSAT